MNTVKPNGNAPSRVMLVGDYPTEAEIQTGLSFSGSAADSTARLFKSADFDYQNTWKSHYYKVAIPGYFAKDEKTRKDALLAVKKLHDWDATVRQEIQVIKPNLIIAMGELAMNGLTGEKGLLKRAGSIYPLKPQLALPELPTRVLCIHNHRQLYSMPEEFMLTKLDLQKGKPFLDRCPPFKEDFNLVIGKNPHYVRDWLATFSSNSEFGVFDVETSKNLVTCICFCFDGNNSISIPLLDRAMPRSDRAALWYYVYYTLVGKIPWVNQNISYDMNRLEAMKFRIGRVIGDTMLRTSLIYPELPKGLDFLTRLYTNVGYYKDEGKEYDPTLHDFNRMLLYNAKDGIATHRVYSAQEKDIKALGLDNINGKLQKAFFTYRRMSDCGIRIDDQERKRLMTYYEDEINLFEAELDTIANRKINARSGDQIGPLLIEMGAPTKLRTWDEERSKWKYSTGKVDLEDLYVNVSDGSPVLEYTCRLILAIRKLGKLRQFCDFIPQVSGDDLIGRTSFRLEGTKTGRSATSRLLEAIYYQFEGEKPGWHKSNAREGYQPGFSMQQQPKHPWKHGGRKYGTEFRRIFVPRRGHVFIEFDLSQAEARVVDVLAEDYESLGEYGTLDKHCKTAAIVNGLDYDILYEKYKSSDYWAKEERQKGKSYKHAANYDESAYNLSRRAHVPFKQCEMALKNIAAASPRIQNVFHRTVRTAIERTRTLRTPYGRIRTFFGNLNDKTFKEAYAHIPQSTIPDHLRFDILAPLEDDVGNWTNFLVEWHDSLLAEVPLGRENEYKDKAEQYAKTPILFREGTFIRDYELVIPVEFTKGENWQDMEAFK